MHMPTANLQVPLDHPDCGQHPLTLFPFSPTTSPAMILGQKPKHPILSLNFQCHSMTGYRKEDEPFRNATIITLGIPFSVNIPTKSIRTVF